MKFGLRESVFVMLLTAIPVGAWWFVFRPSNLREEQMRVQIEGKQAKLRELNHVTAMVGDLKKEIASLEENVEFFQSKLPSEKEIDKVLDEIYRLASDNDLTVREMNVPKDRGRKYLAFGGGLHSEQPMEIKFQGDFLGLYAFLQALENQPRIIRVHSMKIERLKGEPAGTITADIVVSIFFENSHGRSI